MTTLAIEHLTIGLPPGDDGPCARADVA